MPTIDNLAPAPSASDSDELIVSQAGVTRKITRAQMLNGVQTQLAVPTGALLGRQSTGTGAPEVITLGQNLVMNGSTLSAIGTVFSIPNLPTGIVPGASDLVPISQSGTMAAISLGQLSNGIASVPNLDLSHALVTPTGMTAIKKLADFAASVLPLSGGTMTGTVTLAGNPTTALQAVNKSYVDSQVAQALPLTGGSLAGTLTLAAAPAGPMDAAPKSYVDAVAHAGLPLSGGTMSGAILLASDPILQLQAATKGYADLKASRSGDTLTGALVLAADPSAPLQAATKNYVDVQVATSVPKTGGTMSGALTLASDPVLTGQAATKQYVDQRVLRTGDSLTGALSLATDPVAPKQAATKNYVDTQISGMVFCSGSSMAGALLLATDPSLPLQASTKQYVDLRLQRAGDTLLGALTLASDPAAPMQAATKQYVDAKTSSTVTTLGATFAGPVLLNADPVSALQASTKGYVDARLLRSGDSLTGALALSGDPTLPIQAATKNYVDSQVSTRLSVAGGSLIGALALAADPTGPLQASTKHYVDTQIATALPLTGGTLTGPLAVSGPPTSAQNVATKQYVDSQLGMALPVSGGTLTGALTLSSAPTAAMHAATKGYVDLNPNSARVLNVALSPYNAKIDGITDDTAAFKAAYQAAPKNGVIYVPNGTTVLQQPGAWGIPLTKQVKWIVDGTVLPDGSSLASSIASGTGPSSVILPGLVAGNSSSSLTTSQGASQATDFAVQQSAYIVTHTGGSNSVATNSRTDTIIYSSPGNYIWGGLDRLLWAGTQTPSASSPAQHVGRYIQTVRQAVGTGSSGQALPQPQLWAACLEYRDTTGLPSSAANHSLTVEMDWIGNGADDANSRQIQSLCIGQHNTSGAPVEVSTVVGVYLFQGSSGSAKTVFSVGVPFSSAVLDTSNAQSINNAPAIKLAAGQTVSLEPTNNNKIYYDSKTNTVRVSQGAYSFPIGKGITVGWLNVFAGAGTVPYYIAGNMIFLVGSGSYTLTLPAASTVAAGTGFTFSNIGGAAVTISPTGTDSIDCPPLVLYSNDRYHVVSDGTSGWREVFRTNAVAPRFSAPIVLPSYTVAGLPSGQAAGAKAFASNGRKPSEAAGAGTGVEVFFDGSRWISSCSGSAVAA